MSGLPHHLYRKQSLISAGATWALLVWILLWVDPAFIADVGRKLSYLPLFLVMFAALGLTLWGLTGRWKQAGLWTAICITGLWLRINQLDSIINLILLIAFGVVWEYYWRLSKNHSLIN